MFETVCCFIASVQCRRRCDDQWLHTQILSASVARDANETIQQDAASVQIIDLLRLEGHYRIKRSVVPCLSVAKL